MEAYLADVLWVVILGFIIAFILSFAVGANDVANSFATSVGSGVLTFRQACYLATIFEIAGAVILGYKVADTMRKGILDVNLYVGNEEQLMYGMLSALVGCAIWLLVATYFKVPVSTTHSIVGATVGFGIVQNGTKGLKVETLITIVSSWVVSPLMSGAISVAIFMAIDRFIIKANRPLRAGLISLPFIYSITVFINVLSITLDGSKRKQIFGICLRIRMECQCFVFFTSNSVEDGQLASLACLYHNDCGCCNYGNCDSIVHRSKAEKEH
jgi:solute carrier family 20 (sodium-dependent phosphate transporter)